MTNYENEPPEPDDDWDEPEANEESAADDGEGEAK